MFLFNKTNKEPSKFAFVKRSKSLTISGEIFKIILKETSKECLFKDKSYTYWEELKLKESRVGLDLNSGKIDNSRINSFTLCTAEISQPDKKFSPFQRFIEDDSGCIIPVDNILELEPTGDTDTKEVSFTETLIVERSCILATDEVIL